MFAYLKIVFGIKSRYQLSDVLHALKQQRYCSLLVSQHNADAVNSDESCDRLGVHYHGVAEFIKSEGRTEIFLILLRHYCMFLSEDVCYNPVEYLAYITSLPKRIVIQEILDITNLPNYLQGITPSIKFDVLKAKEEKKMFLIKQNVDVINTVDFILKYGCNNRDNLLNQLKKNESLFRSLEKTHFEYVSKTALDISKKIIFNSSILDLSGRLEVSDDYLSAEESAQFVTDWCMFQNLNPKEFVKNFIRCLDKKSGNRNCIYLQGSQNSGKTYIVQSIIDSCINVGHVCVESSAYPFAWEKCINRRLIVMWEPYFATVNFDQLDKILAGLGTLVFKHKDVVDYLQPTPVIIVANEHALTDNPELDVKIKRRFSCCYMNLKSFPNVNKKKLHPQWLNILNKTYSGKSLATAETKQNLQIFRERVLQSSKMDEQICSDENNSKNVMKSSGDGDVFKKKILPMNASKGSQNTMDPIDRCNKRPAAEEAYNGKKRKLLSK